MGSDGFVISDIALAPGSAFDIWARYLSPLFDLEAVDGSAAERFFVRNATMRLPNAVLFDTHCAAAALRRSDAKIDASPVDCVALLFCRSGSIRVECGGREVEMGPGDILFLDLMRPLHQYFSECGSILMMFSRSRVPPPLRAGTIHGSTLPVDHPMAQCLASLIRVLAETLRDMTAIEAEAVIEGLLTIAQAAWTAVQAGAAASKNRLYERAVAMMRNEVANLSFNPERLARSLGVSRSRLYMLFTAQGGISRAMLNLRLDASLATLVAGVGNRGIVSEAAHSLGFQSEAHFSRAFRRKFGFAPSKVVKFIRQGIDPADREAVIDAVRRDDFPVAVARLRSGLGVAARIEGS